MHIICFMDGGGHFTPSLDFNSVPGDRKTKSVPGGRETRVRYFTFDFGPFH